MFKIKDKVEMGHNIYIGGTVSISIGYTEIQDEMKTRFVLEVIDYLDHCLVTDNDEYLKYSERYFLIKASKSIFEDIVGIISNFINDFEEIEVSLGKLSYISKPKSIEIVSYNNKG